MNPLGAGSTSRAGTVVFTSGGRPGEHRSPADLHHCALLLRLDNITYAVERGPGPREHHAAPARVGAVLEVLRDLPVLTWGQDDLARARCGTLHTGAGLLTDRQAARLSTLFAQDAHVEVEIPGLLSQSA